MDHFSRRTFLRIGALGAAGATAWSSGLLQRTAAFGQAGGGVDPADLFGRFEGYGALIPDPAGILDLPPAFSYQIIGATGDRMDDGGGRPHLPDGMEVFDAGGGSIALVMNHEISLDGEDGISRPGDRERSAGGCTTTILSPDNRVLSSFVVQSDNARNCAGGKTPWGTWMTCEEHSRAPNEEDAIGYGYAYDVDPFSGINGPRIPSMGRFQREAVVVDPQDGTIYQTEDRDNGLLYRWIPDRPFQPPTEGSTGRLEGLAIRPPRGRGSRLRCEWIDLSDAVIEGRSLRGVGAGRGCHIFRGNEGIAEFGGSVYIDEGQGGAAERGAIWRLRPSSDTIELFYEAGENSILVQPDNVRQHPISGDLLHCEDRDGPARDESANQLILQDAAGSVHVFARAPRREGFPLTEFTGCCWDAEGRRLFVNLQQVGLTILITGPFRGALAAERARLHNGAAPTGGVRRATPDQLAKARQDHGMSPLEVEAALAIGFVDL